MEELIEQRYQILQKTSQQREKIGGRRLPRIREPIRECTHWDYFLEEMKWLSNDFIEDRKHKQALAYVLITEIRQKRLQSEKLEAKKELKLREQSKKLSEMVLKYFSSLDDGKRLNGKEASSSEKSWKFIEVLSTATSVNIVLENSRVKKSSKIDASKPIHKYTVSMIHQFGFSSQDKNDDSLSREPSTPETAMLDTDLEPAENLTNFQLFYDVENTEKDLNSQLEELHLEDLDVYRPLTVESLEFRDITHEEALFEEELFELVPDSEEYMLWENTKNCLEKKEIEVPHTTEVTNCKKDWKIFEDMILEQSVWEFGGNWEFISDLISTNPLSSFNFVTSEECFNRWACLQKRKGRTINNTFRPLQVFQNEYPPVQYIHSTFSINKRKKFKTQVFTKINSELTTEIPQNVFGFYLKHNTRPESNFYFSNYKTINGKYYNEAQVPSFVHLNGIVREKKPAQKIYDNEEENTKGISDLLEMNRFETEMNKVQPKKPK